MAKKQMSLSLSEGSREELSGWISAHRTPQQVVKRCRIVLGSAAGQSDLQMAAALAVNRHTCRLWRQRFLLGGSAALWRIAPGRGRKPDGPRQRRIVAATIERKPKAATHWSTRSLAKDQGVSHSTVRRVWQAHQLKPHLEKTFKVSRDPKFQRKAHRCRWALPEPATAGARAVRG